MNTWFRLLFAISATGVIAADIPWNFIEQRCLDCHDSATQKGDLDLEAASTDWAQRQTEDLWVRVLEAIEDELMPPPDKRQPSLNERVEAAEALHETLATHSTPGGSPIADIRAFKRYLVANLDPFAECLAEKLLIYATGRQPSYGDRLVIEGLVRELRKSGNGFRDLIVALIASEAFEVR